MTMTPTERSTSPLSAWTKPRRNFDGVSAISHLYNRLDGMYPIRWRSTFPSPSAVQAWEQTWASAFADEGITPQELDAGIRACRRLYAWPPSLTEFLRACRPELDEEAAYHEAVAGMIARERGEVGTWSHRAVYWAAVKVGRFDLLGNGYQAMRGRWSKAFAGALAAGVWDEIPPPMVALPAPGQTQLSREEATKRLAELGASGVLAPVGDSRRWIERALSRAARGEHVPLATLRRAQAAAARGVA